METISPTELKTRLDAGDPTVVLDVRESWEYDTCHIDGSQACPMSEFREHMDGLDRDAYTVVLCHHGMRSQQVAEFLDRSGFPNIANLEGGIDAWAQEVDPEMARY